MDSHHFYDDTLPNQPWTERCVCGKRFMQPNSYSLHVNSCSQFKARMNKRLDSARQKSQRSATELEQPASEDGGTGKRKRTRPKLKWLNDEDLDIDRAMVQLPVAAAANGVAQVTPVQEQSTILAPEEPLGRGLRQRIPTYKIQKSADFLPTSTLPISLFPPVASAHLNPQSPGSCTANPQVLESQVNSATPVAPILQTIKTPVNGYGLYKSYSCPSGDCPHDPDNSITRNDLQESEEAPFLPENSDDDQATPCNNLIRQSLHPFPNVNAFKLGEWFWSDENEKSHASFQQLRTIVGDPTFKPEDIRDSNWGSIDRILATSQYDADHTDAGGWADDNGISWASKPVSITVPFNTTSATPGVRSFTIPEYHYRPLIPLIRDKLENATSGESFHTLGYELRWKPGEGKKDVRVHGEMYNSPAFIEEYEKLQHSPPEPNCSLPRHIVGLMFASDSTMLASFGSAKLWPLYLYFANDSKYKRGKPSEKLFDQVAYFEKLPDDFKDFVPKVSGKETVAAPLLTHCQRELFHEQWRILLDNEFIESYCHGIVVTCFDDKKRRFYPRILTYSADYPEKVLIASIKSLSTYPCPRCQVQMTDVPNMGKKRDNNNRVRLARNDEDRKPQIVKARALIFNKNLSVTAESVEAHLKVGSLNAFSSQLAGHGFNLFPMLVVDVMHEVELGVWKALFIQLLRILDSTNKGNINELDTRYRNMPTFGRDTIRRFTNNISEMKQLAARDFEDLLQCAIPAFEGLLPAPHDARVTELLFVLAHWHGLAKLRMHTDHTLNMLDDATTSLGDGMRMFVKKTCTVIETTELQREYQARLRRQTRRKRAISSQNGRKKQKLSPDPLVLESTDTSKASTGRKTKTLNLNTYKFHALGDVAATIRLFGTTDSYSSQTPESFHHFPKVHYKRTSKKNVSKQLSRIQMRQSRIRRLRKQLYPSRDEGFDKEQAQAFPYFIGKSQNRPVSLPGFLQSRRDDPAVKHFIPKLKEHLLPRLYNALLQEAKQDSWAYGRYVPTLQLLVDGHSESQHSGQEWDADLDKIFFHSDRIYQHDLFHVNYTSYDVRRETDILNPKTSRQDVMLLRSLDDEESPETAHHFIYARIISVFHVNVIYKGRGAFDLRKRRFDFLWVRWFDMIDIPSSKRHTRLDRLELRSPRHADGVGFLDPTDVIRGSHITPRYAAGKLYVEGSESRQQIHSQSAKDKGDWKEYYVNRQVVLTFRQQLPVAHNDLRFVDRDMLMRYHWGLGVGHRYSFADAPDDDSESSARSDEPQVHPDDSEDDGASSSDPLLSEADPASDCSDREDPLADHPEEDQDRYDSDNESCSSDSDDYAVQDPETEPENED